MRELSSEHLLLRDPLPEDWEALNQLLTDPRVVRYMHFATWSEQQRRDWFAWCVSNAQVAQPDAYNWIIIERSNNQLIGWLGIGGASHPSVAGERDFGYLLAASHWNKGLMSEALQRDAWHTLHQRDLRNRQPRLSSGHAKSGHGVCQNGLR
jgi:RimJ/RimL family protein N-acetyltransferase